jgi:hypothetical protein
MERIDDPRQDQSLPFGASFGSLITVPRAEFAVLSGTLLQPPESAQAPLIAVGQLQVTDAPRMEIFNLYFDKGHGPDGQGRRFLQVYVDDGQVVEVFHYSHLLRFVPASAEDLIPYTGEAEYGIGDAEFGLEADLLQHSKLPEAIWRKVLAGGERLKYFRDTPTDADYIRPYRGIEDRLDDPYGYTGLRQRMVYMPYHRKLAGDDIERLLLSCEHVESVDGEAEHDLHVNFYIGMALSPSTIKVL